MTARNGTSRPYRLISSDSHFTEPGDLWISRVPAKFRDRAPRIERFADTDAWVVEGIKEPVKFGWTSCAGLEPEEMKAGIRFEEMRSGGYDPAVRVKEQDRDGVDAEVMYPSPMLAIAICANADTEYHLAMVRAYNDWVCEYVGFAPERFGGMALLPNRGGPQATIAELDRVLDRAGMRGVVMGAYPNGTLTLQPEDDPVWAYLEERGIPLTIHVALASNMPAAERQSCPAMAASSMPRTA